MVIAFDRTLDQGLRVRRWAHEGAGIGWPIGGHAAFELAAVNAGQVEYRIGAQTVSVGPGQVIAVPIDVEHATRIQDGTRATSLWINPRWVAELSDTLGQRANPEAGLIPDAGRLGSLIELLAGEAAHQDPGAEVAQKGLLEALLVELFRRAPDRPPSGRDPAVLAALERIERDYREPLSLEDLAESAHLSRFELSRRFRRAVGTSPYQYLIRTRVQRAALKLKTGGISVTEAAYAVGFSDLGRFARAFKKELGLRPGELLQQVGQAHDSHAAPQEAPSRVAPRFAMLNG